MTAGGVRWGIFDHVANTSGGSRDATDRQVSGSGAGISLWLAIVKRTLPDGTEEMDQVALTLEDVLHPQEGDVIPESKPHEADRRYLTDVFMSRPLMPPFSLVSSDLLIHWGVDLGSQ